METGLVHLHNTLRYAVVALLLIALFQSFNGWFSKRTYSNADNKVSLFLLISAHLQLVIGLIIYFFTSQVVEAAKASISTSMKDPVLRFWLVEHGLAMLVGIILITLGRIMGKKAKTDNIRFRRQAVYYVLAAVLIYSAIPWPWAAVARPLF